MDSQELIEALQAKLRIAEDAMEVLYERLQMYEAGQGPDDDEYDESAEGYVSFQYDKFHIAEEIIDKHVTDEMLKEAAQAAKERVDVMRTVYVEGAVMGISAMREALLDTVAIRAKRKKK